MNVSLQVIGSSATLSSHIRKWSGCVKCEIGKIAKHHVFYRGVLPCDILFVGLAPGRSENAVGSPFVGKSGHLLERWISESLSLQTTYCFANLVCCRPCDSAIAGNRDPSSQEISNCQPRLQHFIDFIAHPSAVVTVGKIAGSNLTTSRGISRLSIKHPSYALRLGAEGDIKKTVCEHPISLPQIKEMKEFFSGASLCSA